MAGKIKWWPVLANFWNPTKVDFVGDYFDRYCKCCTSHDFSGHFCILFSLKNKKSDDDAGVCTKQGCSLTPGEYDLSAGAPLCSIYNAMLCHIFLQCNISIIVHPFQP